MPLPLTPDISPAPKPHIIAVGASAGGLEALQDFLSHLPDLINSCIIVAQHLSPTHKSMLVQLLSRETKLAVDEATHGNLLQANKVYITPPDKEITILQGKIHLQKPAVAVGPKPSVDVLFRSLAAETEIIVIGVILSGTGSDGAAGIKALKAAGYYVIAQEPETAKYDGMPVAAIQTGLVDAVLAPEKMGEEIQEYLADPSRVREDESLKALPPLSQIFHLLSRRTGTDFSNYKPATIGRRLEKRMDALGIDSLEQYLQVIEHDPKEADDMFNMILIGVTSFFRDMEAFGALEDHLLRIINHKTNRDPIRVWVPGCSTGEEAYSIAILFHRILKERAQQYNIQIFATDIDEKAISIARRGIYPASIVDPLPVEIREQYFISKGREYELIKSIRSMVLYSKHDVTRNPPFLRLDLISCRNLLIYFNAALQQQILPIFHYAILQDGLLFLGKSETVGQFNDLFATVDAKNKLFQRKRGGNLHAIKFSAFKAQKQPLPQRVDPRLKQDLSISELVKETLFHSYEHPYVVVNESHDIQEVSGDVRLFISLSPGSVHLNLLKMVNQELQLEVRSILSRSIKERAGVKSQIKRFELFGSQHFVRIQAKPLIYAEGIESLYVVIFEKLDIDKFVSHAPETTRELSLDAHTAELEHELAATKEHLQTYIEEIETSNEELQSLNEELQSTNEELQSSNEELETSNEELQSTNEEIQIAYAELKAANEELERKERLLREHQANTKALLNNDLQAFVLVDITYKIIEFNQRAGEMFSRLRHKQIKTGDSIVDYIPPDQLESFILDFGTATGGQSHDCEKVLKDAHGERRWFRIHYTPVTFDDHEIVGISIGLLDVTLLKQALSDLNATERLVSSVFNAVSTGICVTNQEGIFEDVNDEYCQIYGYRREELIGESFVVVVPMEYRAMMQAMHDDFIAGGTELPGEFDVITKSGETITVSVMADLLIQPDGSRHKVTSVRNITEIKQKEAEVIRIKNNRDALIDGTPDLIWSVDLNLNMIAANRAFHEWNAARSAHRMVEGDPVLLEAYGEEMYTRWKHHYERALKQERFSVREASLNPQTSRMEYAHVYFSPIYDSESNFIGVACYSKDTTEDTLNQLTLKQTQEELSNIMDSSLDVICTVDETGTFVRVSAASTKVWGYTPEELKGTKLDALIYQEDLADSLEARKMIRAGVEMPHFENRYVRKDGTIVPLIWSARWNEEKRRIYSVAKDATQIKEVLSDLSLLIDHTEESFILLDRELIIRSFNRQFYLLYLKYFQIEVKKGVSILTYALPGRLEALKQTYERALEGLVQHSELVFTDLEGISHIIELKYKPSRNAYQEIVGVFVSATDITEQRFAQQELVMSEKRYRALVENGADALVILDATGKPVYVSPSISNVLGYSEREAMDLNLFEIIHPDDVPGIVQKMEEVMAHPGVPLPGYTSRTRHKDGSWRWLEATLTNLLHDPHIQGIVDNFRDVTEKIQADNQLKRSEADYRALFDFSPLPKYIYRQTSLQILDANEAAFDQYGYSHEEFLAKTIESFHPEGEFDEARWTLGEGEAVERAVNFGVFTHLRQDGRSLRMDVTGKTIQYQGEACVIVVCIDVTEREELLQRLLDSRQKLSQAAKIAKLGHWELEMDSQALFWSEDVYEIWEEAPNNFFPTFDTFVQTVYEPDKKRFTAAYHQVLAGEIILDVTHRVALPCGKLKWIHQRGLLEYDEQRQSRLFRGTVQDITEQKKEEHRLRLMESVITHTHDSVLITEAEPIEDTGPRIIFVNEAFTRMTGYSAQEIIGKTPRILQGPKTDRKELARLKQSLAKWEPCQVTTINYTKSGEEFWVNLSISPVADETGWYTHWISIQRDVTSIKQKELQKKLLADISLLFNQHETLKSCLDQAVHHLTQFGEFSLVEAWLPSPDKKQLHLTAIHPNDDTASIFRQESQDFKSFAIGEGLPGTVWETGQPELWDQIDRKKAFLRRKAAKASGLKAALGLPLLHHGKVVGVLVFGTKETGSKLSHLQEFFEELQTYMGTELMRKQLEEELSRIFGAAPDIICVAGFDGYFKKVNPAMSQILGYSEEEILNTPILEFTHPEDRLMTQKTMEALALGEQGSRFENRYLTKEGKVIWFSWSIKLFVEEGISYSVAKNITEQKELELLLDNATNLARIGGWEVNLQTRIVSLSDMTREIHELEDDQEVDIDEVILYYREDVQGIVRTFVDQAISEGTPWDFELPIITAKGHERWIRAIGQAEMRDGICIRLYGSFQDIHQRKTVELRLEQTANNIPGVIFQYVLHADGSDEILHVSDGARFIWGLAPEIAMKDSRQVWEQVLPEDVSLFQESIMESAQHLSRWTHQWRIRHTDGSLRWLEGHGTPKKQLGSSDVYWDTVLFDVTEKKELENLLQRSSEMARIGSWELDLRKEGNDGMFWSSMTRSILGVSRDYDPSLSGGYEFYEPESQRRVREAVDLLISTGKSFDLELLLYTEEGRPQWVRSIGESEWVGNECVKIFGSFQDIHQRKIAELELLQFKKIIENSQDGISIANREGQCLYLNPIFGKLLGHTPESLEMAGGSKTLYEDEAVAEKVFATLLAGNYWKGDVDLLDSQGQRMSFYLSGGPIFDDQNQLIAIYGIHTDISERKQAEVALKKAFDEKNTILESIADGFITVNREWDITYWNLAAEQILGLRREEVLGRKLWDVYEGAIDSEFYHQYHYALEQNEVVHFESPYEELGIWVAMTAYPLAGGLSIYFRDITEQKAAQQLVQQSNERFEKVALATNDAIWDWDLVHDEVYRTGNGFTNIFGYDNDESKMEIDFWPKRVHPEDRNRFKESQNVILADPEKNFWECEYRFLRKNGTYAYVYDRGFVVRDDQGKAIRMVGSTQDITQRQAYEESLRTLNESLEAQARALAFSNQELEQFAYIASHDLQEPLRMVSSFLAQLETKYKDQLDERAQRYIYFAVDGARRMRQIILDLLEFSRVGNYEEAPEKVDLPELVKEVQLLQRKVIEEKQATVVTAALPMVMSYRLPLLQVFQNLIGNALKYVRQDVTPFVKIDFQETDQEWTFSVADNGLGIEEEYFEKIFILFQRLHQKTEYSGTGMGLAIVKKIVDHLGGKIWVDSTIGKGSTFYFTLPKNQMDTTDEE